MTVELDDTEFGALLLAIIGIVVAFPALAGVATARAWFDAATQSALGLLTQLLFVGIVVVGGYLAVRGVVERPRRSGRPSAA